MKRRRLIALILLILLPLLGGWVAAVTAGAIATGSSVHDRRGFGTVVDDKRIQLGAYDEINRDKELVLKVVPMPADCNANGDIFGGWVMAQCDIAAAIPAMRLARGRIATVAVNSFLFKQPVSVGDVVSFFAEVVDTGRTSIKVRVEVYAERHPAQPITVKVTEAVLTYVAINQHGVKRELPNDQ